MTDWSVSYPHQLCVKSTHDVNFMYVLCWYNGK